MNSETNAGHTAQSGRIIERRDTAPTSFFSEKLGRDFGSPLGAWTDDRAQATRMSEERASELLEGPLKTVAHVAKAVTP